MAGEPLTAICGSCHGARGVSLDPLVPSLAGQEPVYLVNSIRAYRDEEPVIDGSKILSGTWEKTDGNIWTLKVPLLHEKQWWFRNLYKNGERLTRSRYPNEGQWLTVEKTDPADEPVRISFEKKLPF